MSKWQTRKIHEIADVIGGGTPSSKREDYYGGVIPWITPKDLSGYTDKYIKRGERNITEDGLSNSSARLLPEDTVLITSRAPIGYVALAANPITTNQGFKSLVLKDGNDPHFFYYLIKSNVAKLESVSSGSTFKEISGSVLKEVEFDIPDFDTQRAISDILNPIDDKIALNRKLNETLEGIARALFQSWFVDFDPVKAKLGAMQHGRDPEKACMAALSGKLRIPPGKPKPDTLDDQLPIAEELDAAIATLNTLSEAQHNKLAQTAAHFPATFQQSELGLIPEGWEIGEIGKEVSVLGGATPSTKEERFWNGKNAWATPKDLSGLPSKVLISTERQITNEGVAKISSGQLPVGTVLMSSRAPVGYLALATIPISINQGFIAMVCDKTLPNTFILLWAESVMDEIKSNSSGSTFAEISKKAFRPIRVIIPDRITLSLFDQTVSDIYQEITSNEHQSRTLAELRDTLLPKLLSGELSVGKAQKAVEAVVE